MRRTALRRRNPERHAAALERQFGDLAAYVRDLECLVCGAWGVDPAHVRTRGAGHGAWIELPDGTVVGNVSRLCREHHDEQGRIGIDAFNERHGVDMEADARAIGDDFRNGIDRRALPPY